MTEERSHFEDIEEPKRCTHPGHNPPTMMVIPAGKRYVHICPGCGKRMVLYGSHVRFAA